MSYYKIVFVVLLSMIVSYCGKHVEGGLGGGGTDRDAIRDHLTKGSWIITTYISGDSVDKSNELAGYTFVFKEYGTVTAMQSSSSMEGSWGTRYTASTEQDPTAGLHVMDIGFSAPGILYELSQGFYIISPNSTATQIILGDSSLIFTRL